MCAHRGYLSAMRAPQGHCYDPHVTCCLTTPRFDDTGNLTPPPRPECSQDCKDIEWALRVPSKCLIYITNSLHVFLVLFGIPLLVRIPPLLHFHPSRPQELYDISLITQHIITSSVCKLPRHIAGRGVRKYSIVNFVI
jgi:hypothetical protein